MLDKTIRLNFNTEIEVGVQTLYDFHTDTTNLLKITPPWMKVRIASIMLPIQAMGKVELDITRFGITQRWKMIIAELKPPKLVCDKALKSPFSSFIHYHKFKSIKENTSMLCDELEFTLPFYPLSMLVLPWLKRDICKMFDYRHQQTKRILENTYV